VNKSYRYYVLGMLTLTSMLSIADRLVMSILLEDIKADFAMTDTQLGLLAGLAFTLFYATLGIPIARLADKANRKNIVAAALVVWSAMTALCGAATGFISLFLARLGVGVGEAGGSPPSYSIIADYFRPDERARAMGIYITGAALGTGSGLMAGGYLAELLGWRMTFVALGIPGVLLGIVLFLTVREPKRGSLDGPTGKDIVAPALGSTLRTLSGNAEYVWVALSYALLTMVGYAMAIWMAPIMLRNFDVSVADTGFYLGCAFFLGGIPGPILGGYLTDYLIKRDQRWRAWIPAVCVLLSVVAFWFCLTARELWTFLGLFVVAYTLFMVPQAPSMSMLQSSVGAGMRALAVAFALLVNNLLGQALGPFLIGLTSDQLKPSYGNEALNYAVIALCAIAAVAACACYLRTAQVMTRTDLPERVPGPLGDRSR
jgi:predicted MFS family arabinose efflux permease